MYIYMLPVPVYVYVCCMLYVYTGMYTCTQWGLMAGWVIYDDSWDSTRPPPDIDTSTPPPYTYTLHPHVSVCPGEGGGGGHWHHQVSLSALAVHDMITAIIWSSSMIPVLKTELWVSHPCVEWSTVVCLCVYNSVIYAPHNSYMGSWWRDWTARFFFLKFPTPSCTEQHAR